MVFTKTYLDEPLKLPTLKGWHWQRNNSGIRDRDLFTDMRRGGKLSPLVLHLKECFGCKLTIADPYHLYTAGKNWHKSCFQCSVCAQVLSPDRYWEKNGLLYCEKDFNKVFYNKCHMCCTTIYQTPVKVKDRYYHPLCFTCKTCRQPLASFNHRERNGSFYCDSDYHNIFSPKCNACKKPIKDQNHATKTVGGIFHKEHFVCHDCKVPLIGSEFKQVEGKVYCERDYHRRFSPRCEFCHESVKQGGYRSLGKVWHHQCRLRCSVCTKFLARDEYIRGSDNKTYCRNDWVKKFAVAMCPTCTRPVYPSTTSKSVIAMGNEYHANCFYCKTCFTDLDVGSYWEVKGKPYCYKHYYDRTYRRFRQIPIQKESKDTTDSSSNVTKTLGRLKLNPSVLRRSLSSIERP